MAALIGLYKNSPTAGAIDGGLVSAGNPVLTPYLDFVSGQTADIKLALRCNAGLRTQKATTITPAAAETTLVEASAGAAITVASATGLQVGNQLLIGAAQEVRRIIAIAERVITLDSDLSGQHAAGAAVACMSRYHIALAKDNAGSPGAFGAYGAALVLPFLATPDAVLIITAETGGALVPGTYLYRVSAYNSDGETFSTQAVSIVVPAGTNTNIVSLSWDAVQGATGYRVYGRSTMLLLGAVASPAFVDTGAATPAGAMPAASAVQIGDINTIIWARFRTITTEKAPYNDVSASLTIDYKVGEP